LSVGFGQVYGKNWQQKAEQKDLKNSKFCEKSWGQGSLGF
jgi:hypothetical protein